MRPQLLATKQQGVILLGRDCLHALHTPSRLYSLRSWSKRTAPGPQ